MTAEQRKDLDAFLDALKKLENVHVADTINGRRVQASRFKHAFQASGVIIILCSVSIPFISVLSPETLPAKNTVLSIMALMIAALTSLTSFLAWSDAWRGHQRAHYFLVRLHSLWELKMIEVSHMDNYEVAKELALTSTRELFEATGVRMDSLLTEYFKAVKTPPSPTSTA